MKQLNKQTKRGFILMLALFSFGFASAQIEVSGTVTDADGVPIVGAAITEKGTSNGTYTFDGTWSLSVSSADAVIELSMMGFATKEVKVGAKRSFKVVLDADAVMVTTVVKTGYMVQKKEDVTGGITHIKGDEIADKPVLAVDQALQGKAAGVQVRSNSGSPGSGMDIVIRGRGTLGNAKPLYVVDGKAVGYEYSGDPSDIESISILKDASSCAMYGARGANGVVIVTTKGGNTLTDAESSYTNVYVDAYRGVQKAWKQVDVLSGDEFAAMRNDEWLSNPKNKKPLYVTENPDSTQRLINNTNWQDEILRPAAMQKYKVRVEGGSNNSSWSASVGYTQQDGIVKGSGYEKFSAGYKAMYKLHDRVDLGVSSGLSVTNTSYVPEGNLRYSLLGLSLIADPTIQPYDTNRVLIDGYKTQKWSKSPYEYENPVAMLETYNEDRQSFGAGMDGWLDWRIIDNLTFRTQFNYNWWQNTTEEFTPSYYVSKTQENKVSRIVNHVQSGTSWSNTNTLTYSFDIKSKVDTNKVMHAFRALIGHEMLYENQKAHSIAGTGLPEDEESRFPAAATDGKEGWVRDWEYPSEHTMLSYFARAEYALDDKYLINATIRRDASSRFGKNNRWGTFPSVGLGWKVNKERFFYNVKALKENVNMFKIRGGWGIIGNENFKNYQYAALISGSQTSGYTLNNGYLPGYVPSVPNPNLKWEQATSWGIGTDIQLFKNKLVFNYDYFIKKNVDNLIQIELPAIVKPSLGASGNPYVNACEIDNRGFEVSLLYRNSFQGDSMKHAIKYDVSGNFTRIKNEVKKMADSELWGGKVDALNDFVTLTTVGMPIASFYGHQVEGIFQSWEEVNEGAQLTASPGDYKFADLDGDGRITDADRTIIGNPHPDFTYGFSGSIGYFGFDLSVDFQGVQGGDIFNATKYFLDGGYLNSNMSTRRLDAWSPQNSGSDQPADGGREFNKGAESAIHSGFLEDGSYLRLKNITLGYTLPQKAVDKIKFNSIRVYGQVQNAFTWTKYSGFDPEIGTNEDLNYQGPEFAIDRGAYPQARTILLGLNIEF